MLSIARILVIGHLLAGLAAMLAACGQKGPLVLPEGPDAQGRASLPQTLNPWHRPTAPSTTPSTPPSANEPRR